MYSTVQVELYILGQLGPKPPAQCITVWWSAGQWPGKRGVCLLWHDSLTMEKVLSVT